MTTNPRRLAGVIKTPSLDEMAAVSGLPVDEVEASIAELERHGLLERRDGYLGFYWPSSLR